MLIAAREYMEKRMIEKILKILQEENLITVEEQMEAEKILYRQNEL